MSLIIILITIIISVCAFKYPQLADKLSLKPALVIHRSQWYRAISYAFIHADYGHLLVNMFVLWMFGSVCEEYLDHYIGSGGLHFLSLYFLSLFVSNIYSLIKHRNDYYYSAVGASGAVMAVVFTYIFFDPWNKLYFFGIIPIPGIVFGLLYLVYSLYMGKHGRDNIGHDAHFIGAIFGILYPILAKPQLVELFIHNLLNR